MIEWLSRNWFSILVIVAGGFGGYYQFDKRLSLLEQNIENSLTMLKEDIKRLEKKQDAYNTLQERTLRNEMDIKYLRRDRGNETDRSLHI